MSSQCKIENVGQKASDAIDPDHHFTSKFETVCPKLLIPDTEDGMIKLVTLVCNRKLKNPFQERLAIASACFSSVFYMGSTLRNIVKKSIPFKLSSINSIFLELNYKDDEPGTFDNYIGVGVNLALMFLTSVANSVNADSCLKLQTERYEALANDAELSSLTPSWEIPFCIINFLPDIFKSYPAFVRAFVRQFLIPDIEPTNYEEALKVHVKPILFQVGTVDFLISYYSMFEIINSPLVKIKEIQDELEKPFYEACVFFKNQPDVEKPFITLLNLPSSSVLDSKNFPHICYAVKCIMAIGKGKGLPDSLLNQEMAIYKQIRDTIYSSKGSFQTRLNLNVH